MQVSIGALGSAVRTVEADQGSTIRQVLEQNGQRLRGEQQVMSVQGGNVDNLDEPVVEGQTYLVVPQVRGG